METVKKSFSYRVLRAFLVLLSEQYKESRLRVRLRAAERGIARAFLDSAVIGFCKREGKLPGSWDKSALYRALDRVFNFIPALFGRAIQPRG